MKPLSREEQIDLCVRAQAGDLAARDKLVKATMGFVHQQARKLARRCTMLTEEDLASEGAMGVVHAITKFDPARGFAFLTYAGNWVCSRMRRAINQQDLGCKASNGMQEKLNSGRFSRDWRALETEGKSIEEIRKAMHAKHGWTEATIRGAEHLTFMKPVSLDMPIAHGNSHESSITLVDLLPCTAARADDTLDESDRLDAIRAGVDALRPALSPRELTILDHRLMPDGEAETLHELAQRHGLTRERMRQIEVKLVWRLKRHLARTLDTHGDLRAGAKMPPRRERLREAQTPPAPIVPAREDTSSFARGHRERINQKMKSENTTMTKKTTATSPQMVADLSSIVRDLTQKLGHAPSMMEIGESGRIAGATPSARKQRVLRELGPLRGSTFEWDRKGVRLIDDNPPYDPWREQERAAKKQVTCVDPDGATAPHVAVPAEARRAPPPPPSSTLLTDLVAHRDALVAKAAILTTAIDALGGV